jgi:methyl-accepting chemotaxis protein PixJ
VTNQALRSLLKCDRVAIYRVQSDGQSELLAEAASKSVGSLQDAELTALYPNTNQHSDRQIADLYRYRTSLVVKNIHTSGFSADAVEQLEDWQVKAYVMTPIFKQDKLWGLLGVYQNREPRSWSEIEVNLLDQICGQLEIAMQRVDYLEQLAKTAERDRLVSKVVERIRQSLDLPQVFKTTARELRNALSADRVAVYQFMPGTNLNRGTIIAEDIKPGYISILSVEIEDGCFGERHAAAYQNGKITAIADINQSGINNCYMEMLSQFQAQANLVLPLFRGDELWGLFCIHQCSGPRNWQEAEIEFARQVALQLNTAIQQGEYIQQLQQISQQLADAAEREKAAKERLQQEVIQVLTAVRPALDGDLTVRAPVTDDEVGTIADVYNNTLSSLRQIVTQMQDASRQVASTSQTSEVTVANLAAQAQQQFQALSQAQARVKTMVNAIEAVGIGAQQVEKAVQQTNQIVLTGDNAMDHTVEKILTIQETVTETDKRLKQLSESSRKISRVVSLISNFTTQTHLLALNASIEAARAGDYGRGFAVVADEVRSLARQSANAATEIEQLVQEIQMGTAEVSTILETGMQQVEEGTDLVTEARENLSAVVNATGQISQLVAEIKQATQEQTQQFQLVAQTMAEVADAANQTTKDSAVLSLRFQDLLTTAQTLKTKSDQFKVE